MSGNQHIKTQTEKRRGRPRKIGESKLDIIMGEYITSVRTEDGLVRRATMGDAEIAEDIEKKHGVKVSPDFIFRYRKARNIQSCHGRGGFRPNFNRDGRPPKIANNDLTRIMAEFIFIEVKSGKQITRHTDSEIVEAIRKKHGVEISESTIRRYRLKHGIAASHGKHGGKRPGAGRPKEDNLPPVKKSRNTHKLTIGDYSMVRTCPSAYDFKQGKWNEWKGQYDRLSRYVPKFRQDGLKSYTPIIPFPDRYSKAQKYAAIQGF